MFFIPLICFEMCIYEYLIHHNAKTHIIYSSDDEREMSPVAMTIITPRKEYLLFQMAG